MLVGSGLAEGGRDSNSTPGPGHYNTVKDIKPVTYGTNGHFDSTANGKTYPIQPMSSGSPRILLPSSSMKNGVVFEGKHEEHSTIGPGHYGNVNEGQLLKKSFNIRASEGNSPQKRAMNSPRSHRGKSDHYDTSPRARSRALLRHQPAMIITSISRLIALPSIIRTREHMSHKGKFC